MRKSNRSILLQVALYNNCFEGIVHKNEKLQKSYSKLKINLPIRGERLRVNIYHNIMLINIPNKKLILIASVYKSFKD
jgi:predicted nucleotidyltransferase